MEVEVGIISSKTILRHVSKHFKIFIPFAPPILLLRISPKCIVIDVQTGLVIRLMYPFVLSLIIANIRTESIV